MFFFPPSASLFRALFGVLVPVRVLDPVPGARRSRTRCARPGLRSIRSVALLPLLCLAAAPLGGQCLEEEVRPTFVGADAHYGFSIALAGDLLVIGAPGHSALGAGAGAVYAWRATGAEWQLDAVLFASGIGQGDQSGGSIGLSGSTLVVGVRGDDLVAPDAGSARVYERTISGWVEVATLTDPDGAAFDEFGTAVAIEGDLIAVGSPSDVSGGFERGSVSVFRRVSGSWGFETKLLVTGGAAGDMLGSAVAIDGGSIAAGAPGAGAQSGAVAVFSPVGAGWTQSGFLFALDAQPGDLLGASLAIEGNLIIAGAPFDSDAGLDAGAVVPFRRSGALWTAEAQFFSPTPAATQYFGASVDLDGNEAIVGEPFATVAGQFAAGRSHRFIDDGASFVHLDTFDDPAANGPALLGSSVALAAGEVFAGAYLDGTGGFGSGTVLRAVAGGPDCNGSGVPDLCEIDDGLLADCDDDGVPDSCALAAGTAVDCDLDGILDSCEIAEGAPDCDGDGQLDSCQIAISDCNANGLLDACESDCNGSGLPDTCDIAAGTSLDCNVNQNPDECDIFFGISTDCDDNGIPDDCDLASGVASDCNLNGLSDTCDILAGVSVDADGDGVPDECGPRFIRGDANSDLAIDVADAVTLLLYVTGSGPTPPCLVAGDANGDDALDIADGITVLSYIVGSGPPPPPPFPECGFEPEPPSGLTCIDRPECG